MFRTIGPVWDGNEVWLVIAGGATFAAFPAWYATMFSGFYIALLLLLVFLIVRVRLVRVAREGHRLALARPLDLGQHDREPRRVADLGRRLLEPALRRADQLERRLRGRLLGPLQPLHAARRGRGRAAVRVPRRDVPHAAHDRRALPSARRRPQAGSRSRRPSSAPASSIWTVAVAVDKQRQGRLPARRSPCRARDRGARARRGRLSSDWRRSGWAFVLTAVGAVLCRGDDLHEPLSARDGLEHRLRATASPSTTPPRRTTRSP